MVNIVQGMEGFYCMTFIFQFGIEWPHMQCSELTFPLSGRIPFSLGVDRGVDTVKHKMIHTLLHKYHTTCALFRDIHKYYTREALPSEVSDTYPSP